MFAGLIWLLLRLRNWAMVIVAALVWKKYVPVEDKWDVGLAHEGVALGLAVGAVFLLYLGSLIRAPTRGSLWERIDDWVWRQLTTPIGARKTPP